MPVALTGRPTTARRTYLTATAHPMMTAAATAEVTIHPVITATEVTGATTTVTVRVQVLVQAGVSAQALTAVDLAALCVKLHVPKNLSPQLLSPLF